MSSYTVEVKTQNNTINVTLGSAVVQTSTQSGKKSFTATAGQTEFTLDDTPLDSSTVVDINGVVQHEDADYTVAGAVITFTEGLVVGDKVGVRYAKN